MNRPFAQVDVFTDVPYRGNPVAVVLDASGLDAEAMQRFANWTNLSETTFVLPATRPEADYRVRIFTPSQELPFAGHPTLGSCHAWLAAGGTPRSPDAIVQECDAGFIPIRRDGGRLAFAAPAPTRFGPVEPEVLDRAVAQLGVEPGAVVDSHWVVSGPEWLGLMLRTADDVLAVRPGVVDLDLGVVGPHVPGSECAFEVRAFFPKDGATAEDPVTGSLNGSLAAWLIGSGRAAARYTVSQGTGLGRLGRIHVEQDPDGRIWVGGGTVTCVAGDVRIAAVATG